MIEIVIAYYNSLAFSEILSAFPTNETQITVYDKSDKTKEIAITTSIPKPKNIFSSMFSYDNVKSSPLPTHLQEIHPYFPTMEVIPKENKGREGETYLSHIIDNYTSLTEYTIFLQDDFDNHVPNYELFLQITNQCLQQKMPFCAYPCSWKKGGRPFRRTILNGISDLHTFPSPDAVLQAAQTFGLKLPDQYTTDICAFFIVSRERIQARPITFYQELREWLLSNEANGFVLEHIWQLIFYP